MQRSCVPDLLFKPIPSGERMQYGQTLRRFFRCFKNAMLVPQRPLERHTIASRGHSETQETTLGQARADDCQSEEPEKGDGAFQFV